jgi:soluble lytic murein transglycosylase-like protein
MSDMSNREAILVGVGAVGMMAAALLGTYIGGAYMQQEVIKADVREGRIMRHVIEQNPNATIKDFNGFARSLLEISNKYQLDYRLIMALIDKESQFNPKAVGKAGEVGLMQIMPDTADKVAQGLKLIIVPPKKKIGGGYSELGSLGEPRFNMLIGVAYLAERIQKFGDVPTGLRAYNRGDTTAREYRPLDRYAEGVALRYVSLVPRMPQ